MVPLAVFALPSSILSNNKGNAESSDEENYENEITDHENKEGNKDDKNINGSNTQTVNIDNPRPSPAICKENKPRGNTCRRNFLIPKRHDASRAIQRRAELENKDI